MSTAEKIRDEGRIEGRIEGEIQTLVKTAIRLMTKKFGPLPKEKKEKIMQMDTDDLEVMIDKIMEYESIEEADKYLQ